MPEPSETNGETPGAQTLRRGLSILKLLARYQAGGGLGVSEIARKLELSKATTVRLTRTLMDEQFVAQDSATRRYQLGPGIVRGGTGGRTQLRAAAHRRAVTCVRWPSRPVTGCSSRCGMGLEAICLSRESGDIPYPQASLRVGDRHPLGLGAGGLAILAAMPKDEAEMVLTINAPAIVQEISQHDVRDGPATAARDARARVFLHARHPCPWLLGHRRARVATRWTTRRGCGPDCRCQQVERRATGGDCCPTAATKSGSDVDAKRELNRVSKALRLVGSAPAARTVALSIPLNGSFAAMDRHDEFGQRVNAPVGG